MLSERIHAVTQRPAAMYHAWGSQNAWLRQIHGENPLYVPASVMEEAGLKDGDWAWVISHHGRIRVPVRKMNAVNPLTVWTWNAIGKRKGAWNLDPAAPEAERGFLLNHLIDDRLPTEGSGYAYANADPVTGQAAWFDVRVRVYPAEPDEPRQTWPQFKPQKKLPGQDPKRGKWLAFIAGAFRKKVKIEQ